MEPRSFGDSFLVRKAGEEWISISNAYLTEATEYEWHLEHTEFSILLMHGIPLTYRKVTEGVTGQFMTPFQSGQLHFTIEQQIFITHVYPDDRKMTAEQYDIMLSDILNEAALCFDHTGLDLSISANDRARDVSWAQWNYIDHHFKDVSLYIRRFLDSPLKRLSEQGTYLKREQVQVVNNRTTQWLERHYGQDPTNVIPANVLTCIRAEHYNFYENQVIKRYLMDLQRLLIKYMNCGISDVALKANRYADLVRYWLKQSVLEEITSYQGPLRVSTIFRKHPIYRLCYKWFERLYQHGNEKIGFEYPFPLKDTFALYEIWCYMKILGLLREKGRIKNTSNLYKTAKDRFFLSFAKNKESRVVLTGGFELFYQRLFQYNSEKFYTFTQRMEPDITLESSEGIVIFDPKYRVPSNLSTALGEMHKYRDGILFREKEIPAVETVFILTPSRGQGEPRYYQEWYHNRYQMGAIEMMPGKSHDPSLERVIDQFLGES
ncbi:MAG: DUF2357 domain-containing protein [Candidatus Pristimantibacillus sp.]